MENGVIPQVLSFHHGDTGGTEISLRRQGFSVNLRVLRGEKRDITARCPYNRGVAKWKITRGKVFMSVKSITLAPTLHFRRLAVSAVSFAMLLGIVLSSDQAIARKKAGSLLSVRLVP